jgi:hypothetical protein
MGWEKLEKQYHSNDASFATGTLKRRRIEAWSSELVAGEMTIGRADCGGRSDEIGGDRVS